MKRVNEKSQINTQQTTGTIDLIEIL